jgi:secondary thiamine-phosphate synthase enzyme
MKTLDIQTQEKTQLVDITDEVKRTIMESGIVEGVCLLFVPHTTAAITLNENWDPDVRHDVLLTVNDAFPPDPEHRHGEGNSPAHVKSSVFGASAFAFVSGGKLQLGSWQGIYLAEFDGPRTRRVFVTALEG